VEALNKRRRLWWARGLLATCVLATLASAASAQDDVVAIVNEQNTLEAVSVQELRLLFSLYRRSWGGGVRVVLVLPEAGSASMRFLAGVIFRGREPIEIGAFYRTAMFQNRIALPPPSASDLAAIALVRSEAGAIALVEREGAIVPAGVKILSIVHK
jgi:hypothetical protein